MTKQIDDPEIPGAGPVNKRTVTPGWKTSEFWRSLAGEAAGVIALFSSANPYVQVAGGILAAVSGGAYTHSRGKVKSAK